MNQRYITFQQIVLYLTIISAFTGTLGVSVSVKSIHLFPYRFLLIFMFLLFVGVIFMNNGRLKLSHIKVKLYLQFLALWLFYAFLSMTWASAKGYALKNIIFLFMGISIVFFLVHYFRDLKHLKWLYWLWLLIFIALITVGVWEVTTGNHLYVSGIYGEIRPKFRFAPTTVFQNQNDFAGYIALTLPMVLAWIRYCPKLIGRALGVIISIVGLWLLILTSSRSCYIAVLSGLIFWFLFLLRWNIKIKALALTVFVWVLLVLTFPIRTQDILKKMETQTDSLAPIVLQNEDIGSLGIRINLIKNALYFTIKSAGFGVGAGNVEYYMANSNIYPVGKITNVHNWWVEILTNYGIFFFVGYLIFYFSLIYELWKVHKKSSNRTEKMLCEGLLVGLICFFMSSISSSSIIAFNPQWMFFGFALAFLNYCRTKIPPQT